MNYAKLNGLIPAVAQDDETGEVLMVGFMNEKALEQTQQTGFMTFYSRSRQQLWTKGETSGNTLRVCRILADCDNDSVVVRVTRLGDGNVCHTGTRSCFTREIPFSGSAVGDPGSEDPGLQGRGRSSGAPTSAVDVAPFGFAQGRQAREDPGLQGRGRRTETEVRS